jgi:chromosome segregation ATPase
VRNEWSEFFFNDCRKQLKQENEIMRRNVISIDQCRAEDAGMATVQAYQDLKEDIGHALDMRDHYIREIQEAEAMLAHITARVQKRKTTLAEYEARILELRTKAHLLGIDRDLGKTLMGT